MWISLLDIFVATGAIPLPLSWAELFLNLLEGLCVKLLGNLELVNLLLLFW